MHSHSYNFTPRQLASAVLPTLGVLAAVAVLLNASAALRWLPPPAPRLDPDRVVLAHQAAAAHSHQGARVILLGDSTCLMGVDAAALQQRLPGHPAVLSLALFIWLGLDTYGDALADYAAANPGQVETVVLLVTPSKLVGAPPTHSARQLWDEVQPDHPEAAGTTATPADWLGGRLLRQRLLARVLDTPLHGSGAAQFGFVSQIECYMTAHQGSLVEHGTLRSRPGANSTEWKLAPGLEAETRALRARLPQGARLFIGLTPGPKLPGLPDQGARRPSPALLQEWNRWVQADALLTNLPPVLPDVCFSPSGHLNELGQARFTAALARELAPLLDR